MISTASRNFEPGASAICCTAASPPECTNCARPDGSFASTLPTCSSTIFMTPSGRLRCTSASSAGRCVSLPMMDLRARRHLVLRSSELDTSPSSDTSVVSTPVSETALAWSGVWRPTWPSVQAVALFRWSSVSSLIACQGRRGSAMENEGSEGRRGGGSEEQCNWGMRGRRGRGCRSAGERRGRGMRGRAK
eukprot:366558-Chlamydomonas_euryale.AAC.4